MPDWTAYVKRRLSLPDLRREREAEIVEDLARQLDEAYREALSAGASDAEAQTRAEQHVANWDDLSRQIGASAHGRLAAAERWHERADDRVIASDGRRSLIAEVRQDLFYAWRVMRQSPGVTLIAALSLALGIGANTAIFSVMNGLLFRPLPVTHAENLVSISDPEAGGMGVGIENGERSLFSNHEYEGLRDRNDVLASTFAFSSDVVLAPVAVSAADEGEPAAITLASGTFFPTLGVEPAAGRLFGADVDAERMANPVVVLSDAFWRRRLQADPNVLGRTIRIRQTTFTVIGRVPATFTGLVVGDAPDLYVPLTMQQAVVPGSDWLTQPPGVARRTMFLHVVGRLKPGVTLGRADASLNVTFKQNLSEEAAAIADLGRRKTLLDAHVTVRDARYGLSPLRGEYKESLLVLMGLVGLLLLLACANVANLLLARATGRRRELALRVALGAGRARLIRQLLTESLVLAAVGAAVGLWLSRLGVSGLLRLVSADSGPLPLDAHIDAVVLTFTAAITVLTGVLFGLAPALRATRLDLNVVLRGAAANVAGSGRGGGRWPIVKTLAAVQVAVSLLLLVTAGLFVRSLQNLAAVPLGYEADHLLMFRINPVANGYSAGAVASLYDDLLAKFATVPGVRRATLSENGLFYGSDSGDDVSFPDDTLPDGLDMTGRFDNVGPGYFATIGIPIVAGRDVEVQDANGPRSCWLGETMRSRFFQKRDPIGHRMVVHYSFGDGDCVIRGVVGDARTNQLRGKLPARFYQAYFSAFTKPTSAIFELRLAGSPLSVSADVRQIMHRTNALFPAPTFHSVSDLVDLGLVSDRLTARLSTFFGALALVMAAIGLYGVLSYSVTRRVSEIGVRMALGAGRSRILRLIVGEALVIAAAGGAAGLAGSLAATRLLQALLFNLSPRDPLTFASGVSVLLAVAVVSAAAPAWRASRTDPIVALHME
jgi:predicted permease